MQEEQRSISVFAPALSNASLGLTSSSCSKPSVTTIATRFPFICFFIPPDTDIAAADSSVRVVVVRGQENWQMAAESFDEWSMRS
jgi:hypothetical protein